MMRRLFFAAAILAWSLVACAPSSTSNTTPGTSAAQGAPAQTSTTSGPKTLKILVGLEPRSLAYKPLGQAGVTVASTRRIFNATLAMIDNTGVARPYLAEVLPQLNSDTWRVSPDGRMETTYTLRTNASWHDGQPLTADDFVFSWQVYSTTELGLSTSPPFNLIEEVAAPDARTLVIRWRRSFPLAGTLTDQLPPLPRHVLGSGLTDVKSGAVGVDTFINNAYWTREYVGLGPYRLDRWDPAILIEGVAFDGHVLGRPKIDRVSVSFSPDQNTALARLLAGDTDYAADSAIGNQQSFILNHEWAANNGGGTLVKPDFFRGSFFQFRPELTTPRAILDLRVRQALAYAVDRDAINAGIFEGTGTMADSPLIPPTAPYYAALDRALAKYPFDVRRTDQLMRDAGFAKGADGYYESPTDGALRWEVKTNSTVENEKETSILGAGWRQVGFNFSQEILPASQAQDGQARATFPSVFDFGTPVGEVGLAGWNIVGIPTPENRWVGSNRGGWVNADFDRLADTLSSTLDPAERGRITTQMTTIYSQAVPAIPLYFYGLPVAHTAALRGIGPVVQEAAFEWNIQDWEVR
ncbi:MAG: peptide/nickel transport system substrate-binding protein [Chloroflexota bacterium]|nr:peptide/nickel transport system substrate-binding protein [Chloroflexota bacterium]